MLMGRNINKEYSEEEKKYVQLVYLLYNYGFNINEITKISNGESLYNVISMKIYLIIERIKKYKKGDWDFITDMIIEETLKSQDKNRRKSVIGLLNVLKQEVERNFGPDKKGDFKEEIDELIKIVNNVEEINKEIVSKLYKIDKVAIYSDFTKFECCKKEHKNIIDEETWKKVKSIIEKNNGEEI